MIWYNLKLIFRNLLRNRLTTAINLTGIVVGLTVSLLLLLFVKKEVDTDKFLPNKEHIYQITDDGLHISMPKVNLFKENITEAAAITMFSPNWSNKNYLVKDNSLFELKSVLDADSSFFNVFQFETIYGNAYNALDKPNAIVLTQSVAEKVFGKKNPIGEELELRSSDFDNTNYKVTAVIEDIPQNSSIQFEVVVSLTSAMQYEWYANNADHWGTNNYVSFLRLNEHTNVEAVNEKLNQLMDEKAPEWSYSLEHPFVLQPLIGSYFDRSKGSFIARKGHKGLIILFGTIGVLILIIAGINYINLSRAQQKKRYAELGIKKTVGAAGRHFSLQSLLETVILFLVSAVSVIFLIKLLLPGFNTLTESDFQFKELFTGNYAAYILIVFVTAILLFSIIPALSLNKLNVLDLLRYGKTHKSHSLLGNYSWLIFQFTISIVLIAITIMLQKQTNYMLEADYGFNREQIVVLKMNNSIGNSQKAFQEEINRLATVYNSSFSRQMLGDVGQHWGIDYNYHGENRNLSFKVMHVDDNFFDLFGLQLLSGRGFEKKALKRQHVIFNESLVDKFQIEVYEGTKIGLGGASGKVIGVVKDFNFNNLRLPIEPMAFVSREGGDILYAGIQCQNLGQIKETLAQMEGIWNKFSKDYPFEYSFLNEDINRLYISELKMMKTFYVASILAIVIACLGLFGIAYHIVEIRTKEVGVRKVNGARIGEILSMLNKEFLIRVLVSAVIAIPIALWGIEKWLQNYAHQTNVSWWIFAMAALIACLTAVFAVSWQTWRVASRNPVEALRYE